MNTLEQRARTILRRKQVQARTGLSRSTIYLQISQGSFPRSIRLGGSRSVGWLESEIEDWVSEQVNLSRGAAVGAGSR